MIKKYKIIGDQHTDRLEEEVQRFIKCGWQPIGGVIAVFCGELGSVFYQAMVLYEEKSPD